MMNLKSFFIGSTAALASFAVVNFTTMPARALTFTAGDFVVTGGSARYNFAADGANVLNFARFGQNYSTTDGQGVVSDASDLSLVAQFVTFKDLTFASDGPGRWKSGPLANFFVIGAGLASFDLTEFILTQNATGEWLGQLTGILNSDNSIQAFAEFDPITDADFTRATGSGYALEATAVPTPALLPGLIGIGIAALRKKQGEEAEQEV